MSSGKPKCFAEQMIRKAKKAKCPMLFSFNENALGSEWPSEDSEDSDYSLDGSKVKSEKSTAGSDTTDSGPKCTLSVTLSEENSDDRKNDTKEHPIKLILSNCVTKSKKASVKRKQVDGSIGEAKNVNKKRKKKSKAKSDSTNGTQENGVGNVPDYRWSQQICYHVLYLIFKKVVREEGIVPFLPRASRVCKLWHEVTKDLRLWTKADLSSDRVRRSEERLRWLCQNRLTCTKEINLAGWAKTLTAYGIQAIADNCKDLKAINVSRCSKLTNVCLKLLVDNCRGLCSFDLTGVAECSGGSQSSPVSTSSLTYIIQECGANLKELYVASNYLLSLQVPLADIYANSPNLRVLDLSNMKPEGRTLTLSLEKLQVGCPNLQVLRLANTVVQITNTTFSEQTNAPGFPDLEELSIAVCRKSWIGLHESVLERIVKNSKKLRLLDIRGCSHISASAVVKIPAWDIEHLYLAQSEATKSQDLELIIQKWRHSLVVLDLSWTNSVNDAVDQAMMALADVGAEKSQLQELDLHGSSVSFNPIKLLLDCCPRLVSLNLSSCRGLPRGVKRLYQGSDEIDIIRRDSKSINDA